MAAFLLLLLLCFIDLYCTRLKVAVVALTASTEGTRTGRQQWQQRKRNLSNNWVRNQCAGRPFKSAAVCLDPKGVRLVDFKSLPSSLRRHVILRATGGSENGGGRERERGGGGRRGGRNRLLARLPFIESKRAVESFMEQQQQQQPPDGYCYIVDDLGCEAYENATTAVKIVEVGRGNNGMEQRVAILKEGEDKTSSYSNSIVETKRLCTRLQAGPDVSLEGIDTPEDVLRQIEHVKQLQSQYGRSDLYPRYWESSSSNRDDTTAANETETETETIGRKRGGIWSALKSVVNGDRPRRTHTFTVMQFNTLAEGLSSGPDSKTPFVGTECSKTNDYGGFTEVKHCDVALDFSLRRWRLLEVILADYCDKHGEHDKMTKGGYGSFDIIAMEEVDRFHGFFQPMLAKFGYQGVFMPKPCAPGIDLGWYSDGCALFWKENTFELVAQQRHFYSVGTQVFLVLTLRHRESDQRIVVAVTHLRAKESEANERIRTMQASELVQHVQDAAIMAAGDNADADIPIIIMGDFNSDPCGEGNTCVKSVTDQSEKPYFHSAYPIDPIRPGFFTTWKTRGIKTVRRVIDYIFYNDPDSSGLHCMKTLTVPDENEIEPERLPSLRYPSDHVMIGAKFELGGSCKTIGG